MIFLIFWLKLIKTSETSYDDDDTVYDPFLFDVGWLFVTIRIVSQLIFFRLQHTVLFHTTAILNVCTPGRLLGVPGPCCHAILWGWLCFLVWLAIADDFKLYLIFFL